MRNVTRLIASAVISLGAICASGITGSFAGEKQFFNGIVGQWSGPGKIVAGKYKGTRFTCKLKGAPGKYKIGMDVKGFCRIGVFSQAITAKIHKSGRKYSGQFLDGEKGEGMDVTGGKLSSSRLIVGLKRNRLNATMEAKLKANNKLGVTISVKVRGQSIPVIGMELRKSTRTTLLNQ